MKLVKILGLTFCLISLTACGDDSPTEKITNLVYEGITETADVNKLEALVKMSTGKTVKETLTVCINNAIGKLNSSEQEALAKYLVLSAEGGDSEGNWLEKHPQVEMQSIILLQAVNNCFK